MDNLPITITEEERQALPVFIAQLPRDIQDELKEKIHEIFFSEGHSTAVIDNMLDSKIIDVLAIFQNDLDGYNKELCSEVTEILSKAKETYFTYKVEVFETSEGAIGEILPQTDVYDITPFLDEAEDECFNLFKAYASCAGIVFYEDSEIDFRIAKEISEKFIDMVEETFGRKFPLNTQEESQDDEDIDYDR